MVGPPRRHRVLLSSLLCLQLAALGPSAVRGADDGAVELYFELKLLLRQRHWTGRLALDQWAGGRMLGVFTDRGDGVRRFELARPLDDPWTFRWYPTRDEVKLGAAVWVERARGDVYASLARRLEPQARERYARWWDGDRVERTMDRQPPWLDEADGFWARRHRLENEEKDPLAGEPTYPFHVLGPAAGRLAFDVDPDGRVRAASIVETMTEPWLPRGWQESLEGRTRPGYGYWDRKRPRWEPRTYETLGRLLALLAWSCSDESVPWLPAATAAAVETLVPRAEGRFDWEGTLPLRCRTERAEDGATVEVALADDRLAGSPPLRFRTWRLFRAPSAAGTAADELQLLVGDDAERLKLWVRVGYRPAKARAQSPPR